MKKALSNLPCISITLFCYFIKQRWDRDFKSQINYGVDELQAILEAYKDLPIAVSFLICLFFTSYRL
jgi:hypothetical protein